MQPKATDYEVSKDEALELLRNILSTQTEGTSRRVYLPRVRLSCAQCKKDFVIPGYVFRKKFLRGYAKQDFCSGECAQASQSELGKSLHKCESCGKPCVKGNRYCVECLPAARIRAGQWSKHAPIMTECPVCHTEFKAYWRPKGERYAEFCSRACRDKYHGLQMRGELNVRYKDNATAKREDRASVNTLYYTKKRVRRRDGDECVICGSTDHVQFHHVDLDPSNNEPMNVVRLCRDCHVEAHRQEVAGTYAETMLLVIKKYLAKFE